MIDPSSQWFGKVQYNDKQTATIANLVEQTWLCRYLHTTIITYDHENEFLVHVFKNYKIKSEYAIKFKCANTENPKDNSILESIHQVISGRIQDSLCNNSYVLLHNI